MALDYKPLEERFIIPAKFYRGFLGRLRKTDYPKWKALVDKDRSFYESKVTTV